MSVQDRMLAAIDAFYDAALDERLWPAALRRLTELTKSQAASFWVLDGSETPRLPTFVYLNFDPATIQKYLEQTAAIDPTNRYLLAHPQQSIVHTGLLGDGRDKDSRAYNDWHERNVETHFRMVGQAPVAPGVQSGVALHRTRKTGRYEPRDIAQFGVLHRHLQRALAIAFRIGSLGTFQKVSAEWLDRNGAGIVLLDEHKRFVFANRTMERIAAAGDGIRLSAEGMSLARKQDTQKLQSLIAQELSPLASASMSGGGAMRASRPSGKHPYGILVGPVSRESVALSAFRPAVCVVVTDPDRRHPLLGERLQGAFGLTQAEARLAQLLAEGEELRAAADKLHITYGTARMRLAEIFQKTDTRRQGELIRLLITTLTID